MINFTELKKFFIWSFIASLVVAALVAVVTVLIGEYTEITGRVFATLLMVVAHSLISLAFIWDDAKNNTFERLGFFINTIFLLIVASFIVSLFGIWKIVNAETIWHIYMTFFLVGFASLHSNILSKASGRERYMDIVIESNYVFIVLVVLLLQPLIYMDNPMQVLGSIYYRVVAAAAIVDGTLSVLTVIFYKLYMHKHPELNSVQGAPSAKRGWSVWVWLLIIFFLLQFLGIFFRSLVALF